MITKTYNEITQPVPTDDLVVVSKCCKCGDITHCYSFVGYDEDRWFVRVKKYICRWCHLYRKES